MGCREFFDANRGNPQKCKLLQEIAPGVLLQWEQESASEFSPGIVLDEEILYQQIVDPTHIAPSGEGLKPVAFQDSSNKGLSVNRVIHSTVQILIQRGIERAEKFNLENPMRPAKTLWGFAKFKTERVRQIIAEYVGQRAFYVYDTGNPDDPSHADICQCVKDVKQAAKETKQAVRGIRFSLYDMALEEGALQRVEAANDNETPA